LESADAGEKHVTGKRAMGGVDPQAETGPAARAEKPAAPGIKIWIDLDNTPHVPLYIPIIRSLELRGHNVILSARDAFQTCELAEKMNLRFKKIGHHYGKNALMKLYGLVWRSVQMTPFFLRQRPQLALTSGGRSQFLVCNLFRIPTVAVVDYEHARTIRPSRPRWLIAPQALAEEKIISTRERILYYRGIKEDVYVPEFRPDPSLRDELGLAPDKIIVTVRPPANEAHYRNPESDKLLDELMARICAAPDVRAVMLPRNKAQELYLKSAHPEWFRDGRTVIPPQVVNGLNLLWLSDLVVSGGGTMNREAAALGVPVFSIFRGKTGAVDRMLEKERRLTLIQSADEIGTKIKFIRREKEPAVNGRPRHALEDIINHIQDIIRLEGIGASPRR
jgi:predicted glycosyltransferase